MKVKDLIKLLQQQDENAEICIEACDMTEDYDIDDNHTVDYDFYIADELTIEQEEGRLLLVSKYPSWARDYLQNCY